MASDEKIRSQIASIIGRPHNVKFSEIEWVMRQLDAPAPKQTRHGWLFTLDARRLMVNKHNDGKNTVPQYSVDDFRDLMIELGWFEIGDENDENS